MAKAAFNMITVSAEDLKKIVEDAVRQALADHAEEAAAAEKKKRYAKTFALMKNYRDMTLYLDAAADTPERVKTEMTKRRIDEVMEIVRLRMHTEQRDNEFTAFVLYFVQGLTYDQIAAELDTGQNTPRRWVTNVINAMSVLLYGVE